MLKQRVLTALVILPPLLAALIFLKAHWVAAIFGMVGLIGAWEWSALAEIGSTFRRLLYVAWIAAIGVLLFVWTRADLGNAVIIAAVSAIFWLIAMAELIRRGGGDFGLLGTRSGRMISGAMVLLPVWISTYYLHAVDDRAPTLLLWLLVIVAIADSGAYVAGKTVGRHKLAPMVSPGKTIEGVGGGLLVVALVCALGGIWVSGFSGRALAVWVLFGVVVALISVLGDLVESKFKRLVGVKDSGWLLPGHGGVLDRIDALTSAAPAFVLGWAIVSSSVR